MSLETLEAAAKLFNGSHFIFHGGEPTVVPLDWFYKAVNILKGSFSIQSNLVDIEDSFLDFLDKYRHLFNSSVGTSLDFYRASHLDKILKNVKKLTSRGISVGAIVTVDDTHSVKDYTQLIDSFIKAGGSSFKLQIASPVNRQSAVNLETIKEIFIALMKHPKNRLLSDLSFCNVGIPTKIFGGNCAKRIRTVNPDGTIYICPEFAGQSIFPVGTLKEPMQNLENIKMFYHRNIKLSVECSPYCFSICEGGCLAMSYWVKGNVEEQDPFCCLYKALIQQGNI